MTLASVNQTDKLTQPATHRILIQIVARLSSRSPRYSQKFAGLSDEPIASIYDDFPRSLFHYTSSLGLLGIVGEHRLWFSDATFMNDGSEMTWGVNLAGLEIDSMLADKPPEQKEAGHELTLELAKAMIAFQPVIFSMSARNNLLNQWRDYGKDVVPYCIEFDAHEMLRIAGQSSFTIFLTKIVYDVATQRSLLRELVSRIYARAIELLNGRTEFDATELGPLLRGAAVEIVKLITRFKNPAFEAEEEWRAIAYRLSVFPRFRSSSLGVVPYYEWHLKDEPGHLPIKSVTVGPSPYAQVSDLALKQFLADKGYSAETHYSTIPLRR